MKGKFSLFLFALALSISVSAQAPSQHGILVSWTASTTPSVSYVVFRCTGTCTASSTWTALCTGSCTSGTSYLDPASGLTAGTTYSYEADAVDANGNLSGPSNIATIAATFPTNPAPPSGCNAQAK